MFNLVVFILLLVVEGSGYKYYFVELSVTVGSKIKDVLSDSAEAPRPSAVFIGLKPNLAPFTASSSIMRLG